MIILYLQEAMDNLKNTEDEHDIINTIDNDDEGDNPDVSIEEADKSGQDGLPDATGAVEQQPVLAWQNRFAGCCTNSSDHQLSFSVLSIVVSSLSYTKYS